MKAIKVGTVCVAAVIMAACSNLNSEYVIPADHPADPVSKAGAVLPIPELRPETRSVSPSAAASPSSQSQRDKAGHGSGHQHKQ